MTAKCTACSLRHCMFSWVEYINLFAAFFQSISYYAGIMLNAFSDLLCSKLCWHNRLVPSKYIPFIITDLHHE